VRIPAVWNSAKVSCKHCCQPQPDLQGDMEQGRAAAVEGLAVGLVQASVSGTGPSQALAGMQLVICSGFVTH
jgi:hypothetical protein